MEKKYLKVTGKRIYPEGVVCEAEAIVPYYKNGGAAKLPDVPPFNDNIVLHGDDGFNMCYIEYTSDGKVCYFYDDCYEFVDNKIHGERTYWGRHYIFDFELVDKE